MGSPFQHNLFQLGSIVRTGHIDVVVGVRGKGLQIVAFIIRQRNTDSIESHTILFEGRSLLRTIPLRIVNGFAAESRRTVGNEDNVGGTALVPTTVQPGVRLLKRRRIVGSAVCVHFINFIVNLG